jgi:hypothetical protein
MLAALPYKVDGCLTCRDDFGHKSANAHGLTVATYQHDNPRLVAAGQSGFILHVEMTAPELEDICICR